ncbi:MAG: RNA polymerase sigma factor RpoD/SigA [Fimbriimonadaceae bacterium]|nr:RNA polymerase sigma factor RpoD/SigA [Fimbriimonadaceae bacterium]
MKKNPEQHDEGIPSYLQRLTQVPLLTAEEERALTLAVQEGSVEAKQRLVERNMRLVVNIARGYQTKAIPLEDLIQEGVIGLMCAIDRFEPSRGFRFSTYATHWIRQSIGRAIDGKAKTIRLPSHITQSLRKIDRARAQLTSELGREPNPEQLATALGISSRRLYNLMVVGQDLLSLDMQVGDGESTTLGALIRDESSVDPEAVVINAEILEELHEVMLELTEKERAVMTYRLKTDNTAELRQEMSKELEISRERVRQLEVQAIKKLRQVAGKRRLRDYLGQG